MLDVIVCGNYRKAVIDRWCKMGILSDGLCVDVLALVITCLLGIITYYKWAFQYWKRKDVPHDEPSFPFGTISNPLSPPLGIGQILRNQYIEYKKRGFKHVGLYLCTSPVYMPIDTEYIKDIMSKNFAYFTDRGFYSNEKNDPLSVHLLALDGSKWRNLRAKITPTFTSAKMKMLFPILNECGKQLTEAMNYMVNVKEAVNIKEMLGHYATDVIGSCAFGIDCNSFKNPDSNFRKYGLRVLLRSKYKILKDGFAMANPSLARSLGIVVTSKEVITFFRNMIKEMVEHRQKNRIIRNDFLKFLMDLKNNSDGGNNTQRLTMNELASQSFLFFLAGFETSSTTMSFCLYELAQNPQIQEKVRNEVNSVLDRYNGEVNYEGLQEMKYLKQVIDEALRKYPPVSNIVRQCVMDYQVPNSNVIIEKRIKVIIPVYGLHHDSEYFPNPEIFDPERFNDENRKCIKPFTYIPFGGGPRMCIGLRFGLMQVGVGLTYLLKNFRFSLSDKTKLPLKMNPNSVFSYVFGDIWLNVEKV